MIKSRNIDPEAGRWSDPIALASSTTASFVWSNPTGSEVLVDRIVVNVTTAAATKYLYAGVVAAVVATNATNELIDAALLTSGQTVITTGDTATTVAKGSSVVGTLSATDATLVAYAYVHYKELTK